MQSVREKILEIAGALKSLLNAVQNSYSANNSFGFFNLFFAL